MNYRFYKVYNSLIFYQIKIKLISKRQLANTKIRRMEDMKKNFNRDRSNSYFMNFHIFKVIDRDVNT